MTTTSFDWSHLRDQFPSLALTVNNQPAVYFDNPGGTQVPQRVIDAITRYLTTANANTHGAFLTSQRSDDIVADAHQAMADMLNAASPDEIIFGPNMTTLTLSVSRAIGRLIRPGDEVVVTRLDHDANIAPWLALEERGAIIRWADFDVEDCTLDMEHLRGQINERTRLVAVGYASNAVGTINDVATITRWVQEMGAWIYVDAVQYAPHAPIDVQALGCDFLACSAYKFFGPHIGILYGRYDLLDQLPAYKVRPASNQPPGKFQTGTQNHEGIAGTAAAVDYLAELGRTLGQTNRPDFSHLTAGRCRDTHAGLAALQTHERALAADLIAGLQAIPGLHIHGITHAETLARRVPTVSFTLAGFSPREVATYLGQHGIFVWDGNYYALAVTQRLGLEESGGMVRVGLAHYNTTAEIDRLIAALRQLVEKQP